MINTDMKEYGYYLYGEKDAYGQVKLSKEIQGQIEMCINTSSQYIQDNPIYEGATFIGLTHADVNNKYVIQYEDMKLKVHYINPRGRYKQVYMAVM